jgi:hypothetical protein
MTVSEALCNGVLHVRVIAAYPSRYCVLQHVRML